MPTRRKLPAPGRRAAAQSESSTSAAGRPDPMDFVHPELRAALKVAIENYYSTLPPLSDSTLHVTRQESAKLARPALPSPTVTERLIPGGKGAPKVRVYMVGNSPGAARPAVLHMHGGGYVAGSVSMNFRDIQELSAALDCVVVSVEYRLAPETRFPGSLEDNYAALKWMYRNAAELGIDTSRIAVKGESAGGGHAATLAIAARDRGEVPICMQVLIYPMLDDRTGSTRRVPPFIGYYTWTAPKNRYGWTSLLGRPAGSARVPQNSVPARVKNLRGLPPAFIGVGSIDLFVGENVTYAQRLIDSGVETQLTVVPGAYHGFFNFAPRAGLSRQFTRTWREAMQLAFSRKSTAGRT
jgi:acetyl esterase/lipase